MTGNAADHIALGFESACSHVFLVVGKAARSDDNAFGVDLNRAAALCFGVRSDYRSVVCFYEPRSFRVVQERDAVFLGCCHHCGNVVFAARSFRETVEYQNVAFVDINLSERDAIV